MLENNMTILRFTKIELQIIELVFGRNPISRLGMVWRQRLFSLMGDVVYRVLNFIHMHSERSKCICEFSACHWKSAVFPKNLRR